MIKLTEYVQMPDGCKLATDIYLPGEGKYPVLFIMTPYGRGGKKPFADVLVPAGYAVVAQDVRGRYDSEGEFNPIDQEKTDGPATVAWMREQAWFDSEKGIGILGFSYLAEVGLALAARCKEVKAMVNVGGMDHFYEAGHRGGAINLHHMLPWTIITGYSPQPSLKNIEWDNVFATRPLEGAAERAGLPNPLWPEWVKHESKDDYWKSYSVEEDLHNIDIPIMHFSGWYDVCLMTTLKLYNYFAKHSTRPQYLYIGPWSHNGVIMPGTNLCGVDFGSTSVSHLPERMITWFNRWLKGDTTIRLDEHRVNVFATGSNRWVHEDVWPLDSTEKVRLFLGNSGITFDKPEVEGNSTFAADPKDPVTTIGGSVWEFSDANLDPGPADQSSLLKRDDVLRFETETLESDLDIVGPMKCILFGALSGETGDWVARVVDISPNGERRWVADGIIRAHLRHNAERIEPVAPGEVNEYIIDLLGVAHTFGHGHKLGLEISGSSFPKWDVNTNSLNDEERVSEHTLYYGGNYASALEVYVTK